MSQLPRAGEVVDEVFRVESELGHGNFGAVYRVRDLLEDRTLALKVLKPGPHDEQELRHRFEREARLIYSLRHPHVLRVYYYGQTASGLPYMAMEFLEGTDLRTLLRHHGPLSPRLVKRISLETLSALEAAHELGIVHRDLKPANIFLVNDGAKGHVKVLDFGFAKALDDAPREQLTAAKTLVGTPAYMSPELVHKKNVGPQADIYALGLIMAEMLTGEKIVQIESVYDTIMFQASDKPLKLPAPVAESPFADVIARAVEKDLSARYQSPTDMVLDLETLEQTGLRGRVESAGFSPAMQQAASGCDDAMTTPHATGLPSMREVDAALRADDAMTQTNPRGTIDPFVDFPAFDERDFDEPAFDEPGFDEPAALPSMASQSASSQSLSITQPAALPQPAAAIYANSPQKSASQWREPSWADESVDPQRTTEFDRGRHLEGLGLPASADIPLDMQRPTSSADHKGSSNILKEILIGVMIGGAILGAFLYLLQFWQ
jgi:serine/threonine protein kinase